MDKYGIIALIMAQKQKCAITGLKLELLDEAHPNFAVLDSPQEHDPTYEPQLICKWIAQARHGFKRSDIERELIKYHSHKPDGYKELLDVSTVLNHFILILVRGGFNVEKTAINSITVSNIIYADDSIDFGIIECNIDKIEQCGYLMVDDLLTVKCCKYLNAELPNNPFIVDLANPDYYIDVLKFFGKSEAVIEMGIKALTFDGI